MLNRAAAVVERNHHGRARRIVIITILRRLFESAVGVICPGAFFVVCPTVRLIVGLCPVKGCPRRETTELIKTLIIPYLFLRLYLLYVFLFSTILISFGKIVGVGSGGSILLGIINSDATAVSL